MINIDTIYQRVLAIANKEQRGYITPQEFNLFANMAQMEIFNQYFYDLNQFRRVNSNDTVVADMSPLLEEKISIFEIALGQTGILNNFGVTSNPTVIIIPRFVHTISRVEINQIEAERLNTKDFNEVVGRNLPLLRPGPNNPYYNIRRDRLRINNGAPVNPAVTPIGLFYIRKPVDVEWGYVVIRQGGGKALYNANTTIDFELHPSEENELVFKILTYAGIAMKREDIVSGGASLDGSKIQQEKQ